MRLLLVLSFLEGSHSSTCATSYKEQLLSLWCGVVLNQVIRHRFREPCTSLPADKK